MWLIHALPLFLISCEVAFSNCNSFALFSVLLPGKHVLVVDQILLSPSVPTHLRGAVHAAIVQAFVLYGQFHAQNVRYQDHLHDFGI